jgi:hypothetical protein
MRRWGIGGERFAVSASRPVQILPVVVLGRYWMVGAKQTSRRLLPSWQTAALLGGEGRQRGGLWPQLNEIVLSGEHRVASAGDDQEIDEGDSTCGNGKYRWQWE